MNKNKNNYMVEVLITLIYVETLFFLGIASTRVPRPISSAIVEPIGSEQNFPPLYFCQHLLFLEKNYMGERRMPRHVQKHPQNFTVSNT